MLRIDISFTLKYGDIGEKTMQANTNMDIQLVWKKWMKFILWLRRKRTISEQHGTIV